MMAGMGPPNVRMPPIGSRGGDQGRFVNPPTYPENGGFTGPSKGGKRNRFNVGGTRKVR